MIIVPNSKYGSTLQNRIAAKIQGLKIIEAYSQCYGKKIIRTASNENQTIALLKAFIKVLEYNNIESNLKESSEVISISKNANNSEIKSEDATIKIASKEIKDSHYVIDISKDKIVREGKNLIMVSCFLRDGYLGRYLIKRNFFYLPSNLQEANSTYDELIRKSGRTKTRYLEENIKTSEILPEIKSYLEGIKCDFEFKDENSLGTTVNR